MNNVGYSGYMDSYPETDSDELKNDKNEININI